MSLSASDFGALEKALNDASGKASTLWTTLATFEIYLSVAFGSVKDRDLFLEKSVALPILNVELPLVAFFFIAPAIFVIFHTYVFLQLLALAEKIRAYEGELSKLTLHPSEAQIVRQRLDAFLILQFLAGPDGQRDGAQGLSLRIIAWITLVAAPVIILLQAQATFLAYHNAAVTWMQRALLIADLVLIWLAWDRLRAGDRPILGRKLTSSWAWIGGAISAALVGLSVLVVTFPGEHVDRWMAPVLRGTTSIIPLHDWLFSGSVDEVSGKPLSLFSDRLVLVDQSFVEEDKISKVEVSRSFKGRDFRGAFLKRADLRKADFTGANLDEASLDGAKLQQANFGCGQRGGGAVQDEESSADDGCTSLRHASFRRTQLQGAVLSGVHGEDVDLSHAGLQGAKLFDAHLKGAILDGAQLQGASMDGVDLRSAKFRCLHHEGASPDCAGLESASVEGAHLEQALFSGAHLQGALFCDAALMGARMGPAPLESMGRPDTLFSPAVPTEPQMRRTRTWRTGFSKTMLPFIVFDQPDADGKPWDDITNGTYQTWVRETLSGIPAGEDQERVRRRLTRLDPTPVNPDPSQVRSLCDQPRP